MPESLGREMKKGMEEGYMSFKKYETQICKTGFDLEYRTACNLQAAGWTVINNRYYIDDYEGTVREIDLLAYKATTVQHFKVYTTLIISCKKSKSNIWALLARDVDLKNPNIDWWPLHIWTNDKAIQHKLSLSGHRRKYHEDAQELGVGEALRLPEADVFAFQEMDRESGSPQNDKPIFTSVTSLMKAQAHELNALPQRRKDPAIYQFNLLSVVDTDLVRLDFDKSSIKASPVEAEHYIAQYIIHKKETVSRIHFVMANKFEQLLADYGQLHSANCKLMSNLCDEFYHDVFRHRERVAVFLDDIRLHLRGRLWSRVYSVLRVNIDFANISIDWNDDESKLVVNVPNGTNVEVLAFLNSDKDVQETMTLALKNFYRYEGAFSFAEEDIPF